MFDALVTAGTDTQAVTLAFTTATSQCGPAAVVRLREVALIALTVAMRHRLRLPKVTLTQVHNLTVADAAQTQTADSPHWPRPTS